MSPNHHSCAYYLPLRARPLLVPHPLPRRQRPNLWSLPGPYLLQKLAHQPQKIRLGQRVEHYWLHVFCFLKSAVLNFAKIPKNPSNSKSKVTHQNLNSIESIQNITLMKTTVAPHPPIQAEDEEHAGALQRYKMVDARLRRLCERKPSGKLNVPQAIHDQWMAGGKQRAPIRILRFR